MHKEYDISVVVLTYFPNWNTLKSTLLSILFQKECDFQIVISDDGSKDNYFSEITDLFRQYDFKDYVLLPHIENVGTVRNLINGLNVCDSIFVKDIGQGDLLHDEYILKNIVDCFKSSNADAIYGDSVPFLYKENYIAYGEYSLFQYYISKSDISDKELRKCCLLFPDYPHGACLACKTDIFLTYLEKIKDSIFLCEDLSIRLMICDGIKVKYMHCNMTFYECNVGSSQIVKNPRIIADTSNYYNTLISNQNIYKISNHLKFEINIQEKILTSDGIKAFTLKIIRALSDLRILKYVISKRIKARKLYSADKLFLSKCTGRVAENERVICK